MAKPETFTPPEWKQIRNAFGDLRSQAIVDDRTFILIVSDFWLRTADRPSACHSNREEADLLRNASTLCRRMPLSLRSHLALNILMEYRKMRKISNKNKVAAATLIELLENLPDIFKEQSELIENLLRPGRRPQEFERRVADRVVESYQAITGELPGDSDLTRVNTAYKHLIERIFNLMALKGWENHGRKAVKRAKREIKKGSKKPN